MKRTIENAEHYVWGDGCDGWHFVKTPELGVIRERMPPGTREVRHRHTSARQLFYVLSGIATFELDGIFHELRSGEGIEVPPGVPHHIANRNVDDLHIIVVSQPHSHGDRVVLE